MPPPLPAVAVLPVMAAAVHGEAALLTHIYAAATAVRRTRSVIGNGSAVHGESRRVGLIRRADKEHTAASASLPVIAPPYMVKDEPV